MKPLSVSSLVILFAATTAVGALVLVLLPTFMFTPYSGLLFLAIAAVLFFFGRRVHALRKGEARRISATGAMNVAMFAYSAAWVSAATIGFFFGATLAMLRNAHAEYVQTSMLGAIVSALGAAVLLVVAVVVERWCHLDDDEDAGSSGVGQGVS
ncbi:DUF3180 family protein [Gleimia europaea]|uniref:DUF3180 domain-containing protein n=1 Tax=Gleimia europaea ACS-120-V-Col10b TaxID=883069 RepID=A0A9W5VWQ5_9ACTO|nr:DUF3180 family protein [Gleimia europaea]EPD31114.1 hypothetical protein HMPREF9238_00874 [Gleimia europaea ACS-120-V-Col10b]